MDVLELRERYDRGVLSAATVGSYLASRGMGSQIDPFEIDFDAYDTVILATPVWHGSPVPAVNAFLHKVDLRAGRFQACFYMMGGTLQKQWIRCVNASASPAAPAAIVVCISAKELREKNCDVFSVCKSGNSLAPGSSLSPPSAQWK